LRFFTDHILAPANLKIKVHVRVQPPPRENPDYD